MKLVEGLVSWVSGVGKFQRLSQIMWTEKISNYKSGFKKNSRNC